MTEREIRHHWLLYTLIGILSCVVGWLMAELVSSRMAQEYKPAEMSEIMPTQERLITLYLDPQCGICRKNIETTLIPFLTEYPETTLRVVPLSFGEDTTEVRNLLCRLGEARDPRSVMEALLGKGGGERCSLTDEELDVLVQKAEEARSARGIEALPALEIEGILIEGMLSSRALKKRAELIWSLTPQVSAVQRGQSGIVVSDENAG